MSGRGLLPDKVGRDGAKVEVDENEHHTGDDRLGQWIRRRCLDGALNRAPEDFYPKFWKVLDKVRTFVYGFAIVVHCPIRFILFLLDFLSPCCGRPFQIQSTLALQTLICYGHPHNTDSG